MKKSTPTENFSVEVHFGGAWRALEGYVGPLLGRFGSMLGPCWVMLGHLVGFMGSTEVYDGLCCVYVGPMLGPCWGRHVGAMLRLMNIYIYVYINNISIYTYISFLP